MSEQKFGMVSIQGIPGWKNADGSLELEPIDNNVFQDKHGHRSIQILKELYRNYNVTGIQFTNEIYWEREDIEVIRDFSEITNLQLGNPRIKDYSALECLKELEVLGIGERIASPVDLSFFPKLKYLNFDCDFSKLKNLASCTKLETLICNRSRLKVQSKNVVDFPELPKLKTLIYHKLKTKSKNFIDLPQLPKLEYLRIIRSNFENLKGIEQFPKLNKIELYYFSKLLNIEGLSKLNHLQNLWIESAKKIESYDPLGDCKNLDELRLINTSPITNFGSILKNKNLKTFVFPDTDVLGGDMTPLLDRVWEYVYFKKKKHFSHKSTQIPAEQYIVKGGWEVAYPQKKRKL